VFFIESDEIDCFVYPCGNMTIFDYNSTVQAKWSEPRLKSLKENMLIAYNNPQLLEIKKNNAKLLVKKFNWNLIINLMINRLKQLIKISKKI
jgi:hypothetical protein